MPNIRKSYDIPIKTHKKNADQTNLGNLMSDLGDNALSVTLIFAMNRSGLRLNLPGTSSGRFQGIPRPPKASDFRLTVETGISGCPA
jgi:hypothetical protein